jgi:hypothetical protein
MPRSRRTGRRNQIAGQFTALLTEVLESPAWRVLSLSARRVLDRIAIELRHHGGAQANGLPVTFANFEKYGIDRHAIAPAIREAVELGLLKIVRQGRAGNAEFRQPTLYQLTYMNSVDDLQPTHEWRRIRTIEQARKLAMEARRPVGVSPTGLGGYSPTETRQTPVGVSPLQWWGKPPLLLISRVGGRAGRLVASVSFVPAVTRAAIPNQSAMGVDDANAYAMRNGEGGTECKRE